MRRGRRIMLGSVAALVAAVGFSLGCGGSRYLDSSFAGRTRVYVPGEPNFDLEASAAADGEEPGIDVVLGIPYASLVFVPRDSVHLARFGTLVRLFEEDGQSLLHEYDALDTIRVQDPGRTALYVPHVMERRLPADPGRYVVDVTLRDEHSGRTARRRQLVEVVAAGDGRPFLGRIRMAGRRESASRPIVSVHLPAGMDSVRAAVLLYNADRLRTVDVTMRLMLLESDTAAAPPAYGFSPLGIGRQVRYDRADTIQVTHRTLEAPEPELAIEFDCPSLEQGVYRLEIDAAPAGREDDIQPLRRHRDFVVRSSFFPRIGSLTEMIDALVYIARPSEMDSLRQAVTPEEQRDRFDAFWGRLIPNRNEAANILELYFSRVEEANLRYSTYKEGWKTDRGMVFILFGPPLYVDDDIEQVIWRYSYDDRDPTRAFVFQRRRLYDSDGLFEAFILQREALYETEWRRAIDRWRQGEVL